MGSKFAEKSSWNKFPPLRLNKPHGRRGRQEERTVFCPFIGYFEGGKEFRCSLGSNLSVDGVACPRWLTWCPSTRCVCWGGCRSWRPSCPFPSPRIYGSPWWHVVPASWIRRCARASPDEWCIPGSPPRSTSICCVSLPSVLPSRRLSILNLDQLKFHKTKCTQNIKKNGRRSKSKKGTEDLLCELNLCDKMCFYVNSFQLWNSLAQKKRAFLQ